MLASFALETLISRGIRFVLRFLARWSSLVGGLLLCWILYAFSAVSEAGKPLIGDYTGSFWNPVVGSYLRMFAPEWSVPRPLIVGMGFVFLALLVSQWAYHFREFKLGRCLVLLFALLIVNSRFLDKPMPMGRVLLPFWPLVALSIGEAFDFLDAFPVERRPALRAWVRPVFLIGLFGLFWNFARQADATGTRIFHEDYKLGSDVRWRLERKGCLRRRYMVSAVTIFYVKRYGRSLLEPSLVCPKRRKHVRGRPALKPRLPTGDTAVGAPGEALPTPLPIGP
jgi:hypothetical protein